jgi:hypothetical protein
MLKAIDGKRITTIPHRKDFEAVGRRLGTERAAQVRAELNRIVDQMKPDLGTGGRTFSSSFLGSELTPWQPPLEYLYNVSREMLGNSADEQDVQDRAALTFGLFVWDCMMNREEEWMFYDPNLSFNDPNREITGKVYFEPRP